MTIGVDSETALVQPGLICPPLTCISYARSQKDGGEIGLLNRWDGIPFLYDVLRSGEIIVLQNGPFDLLVAVAEIQCWDPGRYGIDDFEFLQLVFEAYEDGRIRDVKERMKLIDLANGEMKFMRNSEGEFVRQYYGLDTLAQRLLGRLNDKGALNSRGEEVRLSYGRLRDVPVAEWEEIEQTYAVGDAVDTVDVHDVQNMIKSPVVDNVTGTVTNEVEQLRAFWAMHLVSNWGLRTNADRVEKLRVRLQAAHDAMFEKLKDSGLYKYHTFQRGSKAGSTKVSRNMKAIYERVANGYRARGLEVPMTAGSAKRAAVPQTAAEVLEGSGDPDLMVMAEGAKDEKLLNTYVPILQRGTHVPINPRPNLLLESGRCSFFDPAIQTPPRKPGVRECFEPRPGYLYCSSDYEQVELAGLGQAQIDFFGTSTIADAINNGIDLHLLIAADILGITYDVAKARLKKAKADKLVMTEEEFALHGDNEIVEMRQFGKVPNFGKPGGMGDVSLVDFAKATYGLVIDLLPQNPPNGRSAKELSAAYLKRFHDVPRYFRAIDSMLGPSGEGVIEQLRSRRLRGGTAYCAACNTFFQGLVADGAKKALWDVTRECYIVEDSPLFGSRPVIFMHDEVIAEVPEDRASEAAERLGQVMIAAMKEFIPDVTIKASPALMRRWYKSADTVRSADGRLIPWEPPTEKAA